MNHIVAINGSPKAEGSSSGVFIRKIENMMNTEFDVYQALQLIRQNYVSETIAKILKADTLLFSFPLYVDSIPAPLIRVLSFLMSEAKNGNGNKPRVFAICNCGFYEAEHTRIALEILRNFTLRANLRWGYGIGIGSGGYVASRMKQLNKGSTSNVNEVLQALSQSMQDNSTDSAEDIFITPKIPKFLYKLGGHIGWYLMAWKNAVVHSIKARPHL